MKYHAALAASYLVLRRARNSPLRAERLSVAYLQDEDQVVVDEVERILECEPAEKVLDLVQYLLSACDNPEEQAQVGISELEDLAEYRSALFTSIRPAIMLLDGGMTALRAGSLLDKSP